MHARNTFIVVEAVLWSGVLEIRERRSHERARRIEYGEKSH